MGKHFVRVAAALALPVALVTYLLTNDITTVLTQADKSGAEILRALRVPNPHEHIASWVFHNPYSSAGLLILLLFVGAGVSWLVEWAYARWKSRARPLRGDLDIRIIPPPAFDMSLKAVLERIAYESEWSVTRDWDSPGKQWQKTIWEKPLGKEMLRPLASGDIPSRGVRSTQEGEEHGHSDIPADFWRNAKLTVDADRLLLEPGFDFVMMFGERVGYHDIRLRRVDVDREWPARAAEGIKAQPAPFVAWAAEWKTCFEERLINSQMEYEAMRARAVAEVMAESEAKRLANERANDER